MTASLLACASLWAKGDDDVIVTRQLTLSQRNSLPEKTLSVEMKRLTPNKKAQAGLIDALQQVMDTIASEEYMYRTFVLLLEPKPDGSIAIAARNDDIVTRGKNDASIYYGDLAHDRYHFVVLTSKDNAELLEHTFKRQGKVKFVLEFEFVDFKRPNFPTNVIGHWSADRGLVWQTVAIDDDPNADRDKLDRPANVQE